jgi:hypothetical protein
MALWEFCSHLTSFEANTKPFPPQGILRAVRLFHKVTGTNPESLAPLLTRGAKKEEYHFGDTLETTFSQGVS